MSIRRPTEDQYKFDLAVRCLVRLRYRQGKRVVELAVKEAARLGWRFCEACGQEIGHARDLCTGCGLGA